jgi:hypothetical protein
LLACSMLENTTRNQHFLSRTEQALNALNPNAAMRNKRIYSFKILDREQNLLRLENARGISINGNLSYQDLFTFDVSGGETVRMNLEAHFQKYEESVALQTSVLLNELRRGRRDLQREITDVFASKLLNFVRNPFSIEKVLNTFPSLTSYAPTNPVLKDVYRRVVDGRKPHQAHICETLGISDRQYTEWLRLLFMLLVPLAEGQPNLFEQIIHGLLHDPKQIVYAFVCDYDYPGCLVSDRGFSQPLPDELGLTFSFNLNSHAFVQYVSADPTIIIPDCDALRLWVERKPVSRLRRAVQLSYHVNDVQLLAKYNQNVVYQSHERVFSSVKHIHFG